MIEKAMFASDIFHFSAWIMLIELIGAFIIVGYVLSALRSLIRDHQNLKHAQFLVAEGALLGLSFKLAGTLLKTIELHTWKQILIFSTIFLLRTLLKRLFTWEKKRLQDVKY